VKRCLQGPVLIVGARSDIAQALAHAYAAEGADLILAARRSSSLEPLRSDLALRHNVTVEVIEYDLLTGKPEELAARLSVLPDTVVMMAGVLEDQQKSAADPEIADLVMRTNFVAPARLLLAFAEKMRHRGSGTIIGVSSVAGDRGRASNYIYGASKAGLTALLSGLRNSLWGSGVQVLTVKPGFVRTAMTEHLQLPPRLTAEPDEAARAILRAHRAGKDVIYVRPIWRPIMAVIRMLPEAVFKRSKL
jgi:short-subunit dehydrogenase